jgi:hypothetical protein
MMDKDNSSSSSSNSKGNNSSSAQSSSTRKKVNTGHARNSERGDYLGLNIPAQPTLEREIEAEKKDAINRAVENAEVQTINDDKIIEETLNVPLLDVPGYTRGELNFTGAGDFEVVAKYDKRNTNCPLNPDDRKCFKNETVYVVVLKKPVLVGRFDSQKPGVKSKREREQMGEYRESMKTLYLPQNYVFENEEEMYFDQLIQAKKWFYPLKSGSSDPAVLRRKLATNPNLNDLNRPRLMVCLLFIALTN